MTTALQTDVVVIGAGPAGLFQLFQLGLQGFDCHAIEALPHAGGQCAELYPHKPIYDIPGIAACTGQELTQRLLEQLAPFSIQWHFGHTVDGLSTLPDGTIEVTTRQALRIHARAAVLALGLGAFTPRPLRLDGADALLGRQIFLQSHDRHAPLAGAQVLVLGGDEEAVTRVLELAALPDGKAPAGIRLLHRRDVFKAGDVQLQQLQRLRETGRVQVSVGQLQALQTTPQGVLQAVQAQGGEGQPDSLPLDVLLVYQGISPRLGALDAWGLELRHKLIAVEPAGSAASLPGVYAIGDIAGYAGKRKLIVCAFHEATLAAYAIAEYLNQAPVPLQYTTTSSKFLQRLGRQPV